MKKRASLKKSIVTQQRRFERRLWWRLYTGLEPCDDRGFVARLEGDERPGKIDNKYEREKIRLQINRERREKEYVEPYPHNPKWSLPGTPDDTPPYWHNVVRAYEEDR